MTGRLMAIAIAREAGDGPFQDEFPGLSRLESDGLAIVHGRAPEDVATPDTSQVEAFAAIVDRLHRGETILPMRYGWVVESEASLREIMARHRETWLHALDNVEGCDEMGLRVLLDAPAGLAAGPGASGAAVDRPGTAYLSSLRARMTGGDAQARAASLAAETIRGALDDLSRSSVVEMPGVGKERLLSIVFLVPRANLSAFRETAGNLATSVPGRLLLTGPWPPYNFAGVATEARSQL